MQRGKCAMWGSGVGEVGVLSSRGVIGGGAAAALRWSCFGVDKDISRNAPTGSSRRRVTVTRAMMEPTTYAPTRDSLSYKDVFTTNIFAPR